MIWGFNVAEDLAKNVNKSTTGDTEEKRANAAAAVK
jgi:hypothetical protein